jgi:hypothetical protein
MPSVKLNLAQPCIFKQDNNFTTIKPNTYRPPVLLEEIQNEDNYQECVCYHYIEHPIGGKFVEIWKAVESVESWHPYEFFMVAYDISLKDLYNLIWAKIIWPVFTNPKTGQSLYLPAFGDKPIKNDECYVSYNDTHVIVGTKPSNVKYLKRKD